MNQISSLINGIQIPIINKAELGEFTFSIESSAYQSKTAKLISPFSEDIYLRSIGLYSIITRTGTYSSTADSYIGGDNPNSESSGPIGKIQIGAGMPIDENIKFTRIDLFSSKNLYIYKNNTIFSINGNSPTSSASEYYIMGITNWTQVEYYYLGKNITGTDHLYLLYI